MRKTMIATAAVLLVLAGGCAQSPAQFTPDTYSGTAVKDALSKHVDQIPEIASVAADNEGTIVITMKRSKAQFGSAANAEAAAEPVAESIFIEVPNAQIVTVLDGEGKKVIARTRP